jgi:asparaginyl-tRNA synthetase
MNVNNPETHFIKIFGKCDSSTYRLIKSKDRIKLQDLREIAHLRPRTNIFGCITRIRSSLSLATHHYMQRMDYLYVQTPIITQLNCEPECELFQVTTLLNNEDVLDNFDYKEDFFKNPVYLTPSGQLELESYSNAFCDVYSFGPNFRAEWAYTARHSGEFWMLEVESCFADMFDLMNLAENYVKFCLKYILHKNKRDLIYIQKHYCKGIFENISNILNSKFQKISYTLAVDILTQATKEKKAKFYDNVSWGISLSRDHELYLVNNVYKSPIFIYNYPKRTKSFYMRLNDDHETVASFDLIVPNIGEILGGSEREQGYDTLINNLFKQFSDKSEALKYMKYAELRKFGSAPSTGFGLGFDRLVMLATGVEDIRDVIPYPRRPNHSEF